MLHVCGGAQHSRILVAARFGFGACSAVSEPRSEICIVDQLMVGLVVRNHYKPKIKGWLSLGTARNSTQCTQPSSNFNFKVAIFVDSTTVRSASETRRGSLEYRHATASGTVDFNIESIVVEMKLCDASLSTMAELCL